MKPGELLARLDRAQHSRRFKIVASIALTLLAVVGYGWYAVAATAPADTPPAATSPTAPGSPAAQPPDAAAEQRPAAEKTPEELKEEETARAINDAVARIARDVAAARASPANVGVATLIALGVALVIVWLGLGLTYLALGLIAAVVALPLIAAGYAGVGTLILFAVALTAAFTALMQALRLALSGPGPIFAVARNAVVEAVRLKISLVFIVLLIFAMASLPLLLDDDTPLRYRVQSFLQFGVGGSFWIIALLTLFFSVATVAFEQRDRQIWQTMTKPVAAWQFVLGKWLGVVSLNAVLLAVCLAGVFMFTEYLRRQPAEGEQQRQVAVGARYNTVTADRLILETQILAARDVREPELPVTKNSSEFDQAVRSFIDDRRVGEPDFARDEATYRKVRDDLWTQTRNLLRTLSVEGPSAAREFTFTGLADAKRHNLPLTLRYKIHGGGDRPDSIWRLTFAFQGRFLPIAQVNPGAFHTLTIPLPNLINDDGTAVLTVWNGQFGADPMRAGSVVFQPNPESMTFSPEKGLELSYAAGSFAGNLLRVGLVLWLKLAFLAMIGVCAATFLSFPIACLVVAACFLSAEGASYLSNSLEYYSTTDPISNEIAYWKIPVRLTGLAIANLFGTYAALEPATALVDGRLMRLATMLGGLVALGLSALVLYAAAVLVFRRRELATYSGQ